VSRFGLAVLGGVLAQATLLAAISGMPHHHPELLPTAVRVVTIGVVGVAVAWLVTES
jgi:hypothetical protein